MRVCAVGETRGAFQTQSSRVFVCTGLWDSKQVRNCKTRLVPLNKCHYKSERGHLGHLSAPEVGQQTM